MGVPEEEEEEEEEEEIYISVNTNIGGGVRAILCDPSVSKHGVAILVTKHS